MDLIFMGNPYNESALASARRKGFIFYPHKGMRILRTGSLFGLRFKLDLEIIKAKNAKRIVKRGKSSFIR
jgi:hypothetical protein